MNEACIYVALTTASKLARVKRLRTLEERRTAVRVSKGVGAEANCHKTRNLARIKSTSPRK